MTILTKSSWWLLVDSTGGYGARGTVRYHHGGADGLQDDGEAGAARCDEAVQASRHRADSLLVVPAERQRT